MSGQSQRLLDLIKAVARDVLPYLSLRASLSKDTVSVSSFECIFRLYIGAPPFGVVVNAKFHYNTKICGMCIKEYATNCPNTIEMSFIQYLHMQRQGL